MNKSGSREKQPPQYFDDEQLRKLGHELVDQLADAMHRPQDQVLNFQDADQLLKQWQESPPEPGLAGLVERVIPETISLHHPRYMGHQISPVASVSALTGLVSDFINNGMGVYEMGMAGTVMERLVIELLAEQLGFDESARGVLTSGGSLGNLTALVTARNVKMPEQLETGQTADSPQPAVLVSEQAHYCVSRATQIMGWGRGGLIPVPCNDRFQMNTSQLPKLLERAANDGRKVIAVIGSACSTAAGAYDDLRTIGNFCRENDLWFHVDGAHGAAAAFSQKYRSLVEGIEMADSVVLDFHKLLLTPALATALVFRNGKHGYQAFAQKADYLFADEHAQEPWQELALRTFECTKFMMSLKVYAIYHQFGPEAWNDNVTRLYDLARQFAELVQLRSDVELLIEPESNIVCYRFVDKAKSLPANNEINLQIRDQILRGGQFYVVQTVIQGKQWLRSTFGSNMTQEQDQIALLDEVSRIGHELARQ